MSEAELVEMSVTYNMAMQGWVSAYFTGFTAFVLTAFFVGSKLSRRQVMFISGAFLIYSTLCTIGSVGAGWQLVYFANAAEAINPRLGLFANYPIIVVSGVLFTIGILGSLLFMRDIRRTASE